MQLIPRMTNPSVHYAHPLEEILSYVESRSQSNILSEIQLNEFGFTSVLSEDTSAISITEANATVESETQSSDVETTIKSIPTTTDLSGVIEILSSPTTTENVVDTTTTDDESL